VYRITPLPDSSSIFRAYTICIVALHCEFRDLWSLFARFRLYLNYANDIWLVCFAIQYFIKLQPFVHKTICICEQSEKFVDRPSISCLWIYVLFFIFTIFTIFIFPGAPLTRYMYSPDCSLDSRSLASVTSCLHCSRSCLVIS